jgi:hypothetical protein
MAGLASIDQDTFFGRLWKRFHLMKDSSKHSLGTVEFFLQMETCSPSLWCDRKIFQIQGDVLPTVENAPKTRALIDRLLPMIKGHEGFCGAGGGLLYLVYFSGNSDDMRWSKDNIPTCE